MRFCLDSGSLNNTSLIHKHKFTNASPQKWTEKDVGADKVKLQISLKFFFNHQPDQLNN